MIAPSQKVMDDDELESYKLRKRTEFEQMVKMKRHYIGILVNERQLDKVRVVGGKHKGDPAVPLYFRAVPGGGLQVCVHVAEVRGHGNEEQVREPRAQPLGAVRDSAAAGGLVLVQVQLHGGTPRQLLPGQSHLRKVDALASRREGLALLPQVRGAYGRETEAQGNHVQVPPAVPQAAHIHQSRQV